MTATLLQMQVEHGNMQGMNTLTRVSKLFVINLTAVLLLFFVLKYALFYAIGWHDGLALDWYVVYYPALQTADPFTVWGYFNPPWLAWMLSPLGLLSAGDSHVLWIVFILLLTVRCVYALGGGWLAVLLTILSPGFFVMLVNGQVDILVLLGLVAGSWLLILIKPQVAGLAVLYDVIRERRVDWFAVVVTAVSLVIFALWMARPQAAGLHTAVNVTPWPWGIPLGVALFGWSLVRRDKYLAAMATFFWAPYLSASSMVVYSAIGTSRYGRIVAVLFFAAMWARGGHWIL